MGQVTCNVSSVFNAGEFPFTGEWESGGQGYSLAIEGDTTIANIGSVDNANLGFANLQIAGVVTGSGWQGDPSSPAVIIAFPSGYFQNAFTQVTFTPASGGAGPQTLYSANAVFQPDIPGTGNPEENLTLWTWGVGTATDYFANGVITNVTFGVANSSPSNSMNLFATVASDSEIDLSWTDSANTAINYNLARDNVVIAQLANSVFAYADTGLEPSTTYYYSITGVDASNNAVYLPANTNATTEAAPMAVDVSYLGSAINGMQFFTANGANVAIGGSVYTYSEGTLTPCNTYTDVTGTTLNPNPLIINTDGFLDTEIWSETGSNTRVQVYDQNGILLQDLDNIPGIPYIPGDQATIYVIDSVYSTDTANAASANAVNWARNIANAAYNAANTDANNIANVQANLINVSSNSINMYSPSGTFVANGNTIYWQNTSFANVEVTANGTNAFNIAFVGNNSTSSNTTNSSVTIGGITFQWAFYAHTVAGEAGPYVDDFPVAFSHACLGVQMTTQGGPGAAPLVLNAFTKSAFTWYTGYGGADSTGQWIFAYGY